MKISTGLLLLAYCCNSAAGIPAQQPDTKALLEGDEPLNGPSTTWTEVLTRGGSAIAVVHPHPTYAHYVPPASGDEETETIPEAVDGPSIQNVGDGGSLPIAIENINVAASKTLESSDKSLSATFSVGILTSAPEAGSGFRMKTRTRHWSRPVMVSSGPVASPISGSATSDDILFSDLTNNVPSPSLASTSSGSSPSADAVASGSASVLEPASTAGTDAALPNTTSVVTDALSPVLPLSENGIPTVPPSNASMPNSLLFSVPQNSTYSPVSLAAPSPSPPQDNAIPLDSSELKKCTGGSYSMCVESYHCENEATETARCHCRNNVAEGCDRACGGNENPQPEACPLLPVGERPSGLPAAGDGSSNDARIIGEDTNSVRRRGTGPAFWGIEPVDA